jgi:hypothetical protein
VDGFFITRGLSMSISTAIREIIDRVQSGHIFDSHYVIEELIKKYSDDYLEFASSISCSLNRTLTVHGNIAQEIARLEPAIISRMKELSWSNNIHGNASSCICWKKL